MIHPVLSWRSVPGWFDYAEIYDRALSEFGRGSHFVEVGSHLGRSTIYMARGIRRLQRAHSVQFPLKYIEFDCIDIWTGGRLELFLGNIRRAQVDCFINPIRMDSTLAGHKYYSDRSLDFVWIDADHEYEKVKEDLLVWQMKVKRGGLLCGHDYASNDFPGVFKAVKEVLGDVEEIGNSFIYRV